MYQKDTSLEKLLITLFIMKFPFHYQVYKVCPGRVLCQVLESLSPR